PRQSQHQLTRLFQEYFTLPHPVPGSPLECDTKSHHPTGDAAVPPLIQYKGTGPMVKGHQGKGIRLNDPPGKFTQPVYLRRSQLPYIDRFQAGNECCLWECASRPREVLGGDNSVNFHKRPGWVNFFRMWLKIALEVLSILHRNIHAY